MGGCGYDCVGEERSVFGGTLLIAAVRYVCALGGSVGGVWGCDCVGGCGCDCVGEEGSVWVVHS